MSADAASSQPWQLELPRLGFGYPAGAPFEELVRKEWLVTDGLGGYASSTVAGCNTRRYHGLFIPALPAPLGRVVMLPRLGEQIEVAGGSFRLDGWERLDGARDEGAVGALVSFVLDGLIPEWRFQLGPLRLEKRLWLGHRQSLLFLSYRHAGGPRAALRLRPFPTFRLHDRPIPAPAPPAQVRGEGTQIQLFPGSSDHPLALRLVAPRGGRFVAAPEALGPLCYRVEKARGLDHQELLSSPGYFETTLEEGEVLFLVVGHSAGALAKADPEQALEAEQARQRSLLVAANIPPDDETFARLALAADQYIIEPSTRPADEAWAQAHGAHARSVIAGYHWFTDWGRDTMLSLEGLTLCTGRQRTAAAILRTFQHHVRDGLLPNLFPEGANEGLYHTADATLWFFHALDRYLARTGDRVLLGELFPTLQAIVEAHFRGTRFGIGVDPSDGLLRQGSEGYQLTWMDAKVDGWVVTPRRGKAVELSALWFNALCLMVEWAEALSADPTGYQEAAALCRRSFNVRFWNPLEHCLFDVVDSDGKDDPSVRPNQVFAISLRHPVLAHERWQAVLDKVSAELLTPFGLRSLSPHDQAFQSRYDGILRARDAAYHQGTVWAWLLGHFIDAQLKLSGDRAGARAKLDGLRAHLREAGLGQVSEIFDGTAPYRPRGCIAQAWSVAELLRIWEKTAPG